MRAQGVSMPSQSNLDKLGLLLKDIDIDRWHVHIDAKEEPPRGRKRAVHDVDKQPGTKESQPNAPTQKKLKQSTDAELKLGRYK
jgi:hypothetical protein